MGNGQGSAHLFFSGEALAPLKFVFQTFQGGGGFFRSNFDPKNYHFSDSLSVIFWYIFILCFLNDTY